IDPEDGGGAAAWGPVLRLAEVDAVMPVVGEPSFIEGEMRWGGLSYRRVAARISRTLAVSSFRTAVVADVRAVSSGAPLDEWPALGDDHAVPGLRWGEVRGRARAVGGVDVAHPLFSGHARLRVRTGSVVMDFDEIDRSRWVTGGQLGVLWPIPLGKIGRA